jgi:hypothetical protein
LQAIARAEPADADAVVCLCRVQPAMSACSGARPPHAAAVMRFRSHRPVRSTTTKRCAFEPGHKHVLSACLVKRYSVVRQAVYFHTRCTLRLVICPTAPSLPGSVPRSLVESNTVESHSVSVCQADQMSPCAM